MDKIDLKRELAHLYNPSTHGVTRVNVPAMNFLMIDGAGDPNSAPAYAEAVEALFAVSFTLKFAWKKSALADYVVMPLEGLWWAEDMTAFTDGDRASWLWTMMVMQPDFISLQLVDEAVHTVQKKKSLPALPKLRFESFAEGEAAQTMHVGPFSSEGPTIERVHSFIATSGAQLAGKHHEIYLSDIRRADPSKWRTVVRQPLR